MESLPPSLRHLNQQQQPLSQSHNGYYDPTHDPDPVPVIDLQSVKEEKRRLEDACKQWGVFRLVNHGIPSTLLRQLQGEAKQLFSLPFEAKEGSCKEGGGAASYFWGTPALTPSGLPLNGGAHNLNLVEGFAMHLGQLSRFHPPLPQLDSFRVSLVEYGKHLKRIATTLFKAMVKSLDLKVEASMRRSYLAENTGFVRVYRYPRCYQASVGWGIEEHTDSSVLSILSQDDEVSGLEFLKDDQWLTVKPIPNTLIVNIGDMMQAISDDRYKSVYHRVKTNSQKERMSICYFVFPDEDAEIDSHNYRPFTYNEFRAQVQHDIKVTGHKVGLSRFYRNGYT